MSSIPLAALATQPPAPPQNPIEQAGRAFQLKDMMQNAPLQTQALQQSTQLQALQLKDQETLRNLAPNHVQKDSDGKVTGFDFPGLIKEAGANGVSPTLLNQMQNANAQATKNLADADEATRTNEQAKNKSLFNALESVRSVKDPAGRQQALQDAMPTLQKQGVDTSKLQTNAPITDDLLNQTEAGLGMHAQVLSDAATAAKTAKDAADAALANSKVAMSANSKPGDFDKAIDTIVPPGSTGQTQGLNQQTKVVVNTLLSKGDYEGASKALENASTTLSKTRETEYVQNREDYRAAMARQSSQSNQLQKNGLEQVEKLWTDPQHGYTQFLAQANATKSAVAQAKDGNELAASLAPLMTVLGVNSFAGVHRINPQEYAAAGPEVGSIYRQINTTLDKATQGTLNPDTANEMSKLVDGLIEAKHASLVPASQLIAKNSGLDPSKTTVFDKTGKLDTLDNVSKPAAPPPAAQKMLSMTQVQQAAKDHGISVEEATRQAKAAGYTVQ